jgi:hypothetical protein
MGSFLRPRVSDAMRVMPDPQPADAVFVPRPRAARRRAASLVDVTLDAAQRDAVALPPGRALLVLGEAGHGKTTVALHRLARLWHASSRSLRAAVIVPTEGLTRLLQPLLRALGVDVEVVTYDRCASPSRSWQRASQGASTTMRTRPPGELAARARSRRAGTCSTSSATASCSSAWLEPRRPCVPATSRRRSIARACRRT